MDKVILAYAAFFIGLFVLIYIKAFVDRKERKARFYKRIKDNWGKSSERNYSFEEMDKLTHYFYLKQQTEFVIDDITWNDLDMDRVFRQMNQTCSSIGEEYLYNLLRSPCFDEAELRRRDRFIRYFDENEAERMLVQEIFGNIGRTRAVSAIGYLTQFEELTVKNPWRYYRHQLALLSSVLCVVLVPAFGMIAIIMAIVWNVSSYYKEKREIDVYLESFSYISNVIDKVCLFEKVESDFLDSYAKGLVKKAKILEKFRKGKVFLKAGSDLSGGLEDVVMDYVRILLHVDLQQFNKMLGELYTHKETLMLLYEELGYLESMISIASYRKVLGRYAIPHFSMEKGIEADNIYHPLIEEPVANSIKTKQSVLLTGSNASGKSTFLKTMAINCILAQTINTTAADRFVMPMGRVYSSMALQDNLESEESYYIVEIKSLKRIMDASEESGVIICFVDEVLRGTNTVERIAASTEILNSLSDRQLYCFAATHDIELTYLVKSYDNYHFSENVVDNQVLFDYQLKNGRATSRNAIQLLAVMGYQPEIIKQAQNRAQYFMEHNKWKS